MSVPSLKGVPDRKLAIPPHTAGEGERIDKECAIEEEPIFLDRKLVTGKLRQWPRRQPLPWTSKIHTTPCHRDARPRTETEIRRNMIQREWPKILRTTALGERAHSSVRIGVETEQSGVSRNKGSCDDFPDFAVW